MSWRCTKIRSTAPKSERFHGDSLEPVPNKDSEKAKKGPRKRSDASGGRRVPENHPKQVLVHELPEEERRCTFCGKIFTQAAFTKKGATVIKMQITLTVTEHHQACYEPTCDCQIPKLTTAPAPPRAMSRSLYSDDLWLTLMMMKYSQQIPTNRCIEWLAMHGLDQVSPSTICAGFARISEIFSPLDALIIDHNRQAAWWLADESGLKVFVKRQEREGRHWAVWQVRSCDTVVYMLSSTQQASEILTYFADAPNGEVLLSDRAQTFKTLDIWFAIAFCWAHMRRDFVRTGKYCKGNRSWAVQWLARIRQVYRIFRRRKKEPPGSDAFLHATAKKQKAKTSIRKILYLEIAQNNLKKERRKILTSLDTHWTGLWTFIEDCRLPIDNNETEQGFRPLAVTIWQ